MWRQTQPGGWREECDWTHDARMVLRLLDQVQEKMADHTWHSGLRGRSLS